MHRGAAGPGRTLRRWLELDEDAFYATLLLRLRDALLPGQGGRTRRPHADPAERRLCARWREEELRLLRPRLILTVGGLAAQALVGARSLADCIGKSYLVGDAITIPLPHPSGASGWLNDPVNRRRLGKALTHARRELARLDED